MHQNSFAASNKSKTTQKYHTSQATLGDLAEETALFRALLQTTAPKPKSAEIKKSSNLESESKMRG